MKPDAILRVIVDPPRAGALNMAVDEAILTAVNEGSSGPTLRFYQWAEPTISLGYFQKIEEFNQQQEPISRLPVVRRQTGGGAILHDDELTYSLSLPLNEKVTATDIEPMYKTVHDAFTCALARWQVKADYRGDSDQGSDRGSAQRGPFFCFARKHRLDLVAAGEKLMGSAQRRIKNAVLQHGSLILARNFPQQPCAQLKKLTANDISLSALTTAVAEIIAGELSLKIIHGQLSPAEKECAQELREKYQGPQWTAQR